MKMMDFSKFYLQFVEKNLAAFQKQNLNSPIFFFFEKSKKSQSHLLANSRALISIDKNLIFTIFNVESVYRWRLLYFRVVSWLNYNKNVFIIIYFQTPPAKVVKIDVEVSNGSQMEVDGEPQVAKERVIPVSMETNGNGTAEKVDEIVTETVKIERKTESPERVGYKKIEMIEYKKEVQMIGYKKVEMLEYKKYEMIEDKKDEEVVKSNQTTVEKQTETVVDAGKADEPMSVDEEPVAVVVEKSSKVEPPVEPEVVKEPVVTVEAVKQVEAEKEQPVKESVSKIVKEDTKMEQESISPAEEAKPEVVKEAETEKLAAPAAKKAKLEAAKDTKPEKAIEKVAKVETVTKASLSEPKAMEVTETKEVNLF